MLLIPCAMLDDLFIFLNVSQSYEMKCVVSLHYEIDVDLDVLEIKLSIYFPKNIQQDPLNGPRKNLSI